MYIYKYILGKGIKELGIKYICNNLMFIENIQYFDISSISIFITR